jgi:Tfp pilus assembly protein PilN
MIRINLLAGERTPQKTKKAAPGEPGAVQLYLFLAVFVLGSIAACVFGWLYMSARIRTLDSQIQVAQARKAELEVIAKQVAEFERQEKLLEAKLKTIRELKALQKSAVRLVDEISTALPEFVWLEQMDQTGSGLKFTGKTNNFNAIAEFIEKLQDAPHPARSDGTQPSCDPGQAAGCWFPSVTLGTSTDRDRIITFTLDASFQPPPPETPPAAQQPAAAPAPAAGN